MSNHTLLRVLQDAVDKLIDDGKLEETVLDYMPQSHVFYPFEDGDSFDEDEIESIKLVGEQDVQNKIGFLTGLLQGVE